MTNTTNTTNPMSDVAGKICANIGKVIKGKDKEIEILVSAMMAGGHILLEDVPGTGKTVLAKAVASSISGVFQRIQFTPDLLPSDVTGVNIYSMKTEEFRLKKGGVFTNILLADEINRATPRTQSALLECMEERQVTIDGVTYPLDAPFVVIATQNPIETSGTFPLPEAQLDRFLIQLSLGYADRAAELEVLENAQNRHALHSLSSVVTKEELVDAASMTEKIEVNSATLGYIVDLGEKTRNHTKIKLGLSTRGLIAVKRMAQAFSGIAGRSYVTPDDIKAVFPYVAAHRLILREYGFMHNREAGLAVAQDILDSVPVPIEQDTQSAPTVQGGEV